LVLSRFESQPATVQSGAPKGKYEVAVILKLALSLVHPHASLPLPTGGVIGLLPLLS